MKLKRSLFAIGSFAPNIIFIVFTISQLFVEYDSNPDGLFTAADLYPGVFGKITLAIIACGILLALYFAYRVAKGDYVGRQNRILWVVLLVLGNAPFLPVFWFLFVRQSPRGVAG